jgi:hypothetical protein
MVARCALIDTTSEIGYCYIKFAEAFEDFVARELPRGLATFDPAFIQVSHLGEVWEIHAVYVNDGTRAILWRTSEKPAWIGKLRKEKSDGCNAETKTGGGTSCGASQDPGQGDRAQC